MNKTAKFVNVTLRWKKVNKTGLREDQKGEDGCHNADYEQGYKSLLPKSDSTNYELGLLTNSQVCSIKQSPYRILKVCLFYSFHCISLSF